LKQPKNKNKTKKMLLALIKPVPAKNDPFGSYTGVPVNQDETPVQDSDDL